MLPFLRLKFQEEEEEWDIRHANEHSLGLLSWLCEITTWACPPEVGLGARSSGKDTKLQK